MKTTEHNDQLSLFARTSVALTTAVALILSTMFGVICFYFYLDFPVEELKILPRLSENVHIDICYWIDCASPILRVLYKTLWNYFFMVLFFIQHYFMSQSGFKAFMSAKLKGYGRFERSIYNILASVFSLLMFFLWQPLIDFNFKVPTSFIAINLILKLACLTLMTLAFLQIDLFHLKQCYTSSIQGKGSHKEEFKLITSGAYSFSRNPIFVGLNLMAITPMNYNLGFLLNYIGLLLIQAPSHIQEDRYLHEIQGYDDYARRVPRFINIPFFSNLKFKKA